MKNYLTFLSAISMLSIGTVSAQEAIPVAKASVVQNGKTHESAQFPVSGNPTFEYDSNGKLIMTIDGNSDPVAALSFTNGASMEVRTTNYDSSTNKREVIVSSVGYGTLFSAFQTVVPEGDVKVYAPSYNYASSAFKLNENTLLAPGTIIPIETGVILKNQGTAAFEYSAESADQVVSDLSGSAIDMPVNYFSGQIYSLSQGDNGVVAFRRYTPATTKAGKAFYVVDEMFDAKEIIFSFDDDETAIVSKSKQDKATNSDAYNTAGQRVNKAYKGIIVRNGKKYLNR